MLKLFSKRKDGFTLVELLIVLIVLGVIFAILASLFYLPMRNAHFTQEQFRAFEEARKMLEILRKELALARNAEATNTSFEQITPSASQIVFYYKDGAFYVKTSKVESKLAEVSLSLSAPLFRVVVTSSSPPLPKKYVKVYLVHSNPSFKLETSIGLLNSFQLTEPGTTTVGNVLIVTK
ncbi:PulJ/GspJ family protein [Thermotoga caldifontis]|uniref:PulJ/GspJ family protein n=1 Tax=Thermotoga caldifontis TaxID=1508419 RepID=UPI0005977AEE|nr:type II secretion system protein [Thermotoga caldifontis]